MNFLAFQQCKYARISPRATLHLQPPIRSSQYQITRLTNVYYVYAMALNAVHACMYSLLIYLE